MTVRSVSDSVRFWSLIFSANLRRKLPLIARRPHFDCAPLHLRTTFKAASIDPTTLVRTPGVSMSLTLSEMACALRSGPGSLRSAAIRHSSCGTCSARIIPCSRENPKIRIDRNRRHTGPTNAIFPDYRLNRVYLDRCRHPQLRFPMQELMHGSTPLRIPNESVFMQVGITISHPIVGETAQASHTETRILPTDTDTNGVIL
jgi:hypothetical protein